MASWLHGQPSVLAIDRRCLVCDGKAVMRRKAVALVLIAVIGIAGFLLWPDNSSKQVLSDGTVLVLSGVMVGRTNVYSHGTRLSKILGPLAPSNGINVAGLKLERPQRVVMPASEGNEILTAELWLGPGSPQEKTFLSPPFYRKHRLLISGDDEDGFTFVKEFHDFKKQADGLFSLIWAESYPRDSRRLHFRLEERASNTNRDWREVATFVVANPKRAQVEPWKAERSTRLKLSDRLEVEIGELTVRHEPIHPTDIWEYTAFLPMRVFSDGQLATNWGIDGGLVQDAIGNYSGLNLAFTKRITNSWTEYRIHHPLDPTKAWKFKVGFARDSDFPATNLFSFSVPWPLIGVIQTNLGAFPLQIGFWNTDMLSVELTNKPANLRLTLVKVVDDDGGDLDDRTGNWGQHHFSKMLKVQRAATPKPVRVHATIAIHENYPAEFILRPRYERKAKP